VGRAANRPLPPSTQIISSVSPARPADQVAEKAFPFGGTLAGCQAEVDDLLFAVRPEPEGDQHRPPDGTGAGLAREHDAVEHQHAVVVLERARMKGSHHRIELLGDQAHRGRADRPPEDRQQR
jgi:hypothetical protein